MMIAPSPRSGSLSELSPDRKPPLPRTLTDNTRIRQFRRADRGRQTGTQAAASCWPATPESERAREGTQGRAISGYPLIRGRLVTPLSTLQTSHSRTAWIQGTTSSAVAAEFTAAVHSGNMHWLLNWRASQLGAAAGHRRGS